MKRGRKWVVLLIAAMVLAAAMAFVSRRDNAHTMTLPNGSTVAILKTSYGQATHRIVRGGIWQKALYGWVPPEWLDMCRYSSPFAPTNIPLRQAIALRAMKHISATYTTTNTLVVWFRQTSEKAALPNLRVLPVDSDGDVWTEPLVLPDSLSQGGSQSGAISPERYFYFPYQAFPRRERDVSLRVFVQNGKNWEPAGEFKIRNPVFRDYPHWSAGVLPITASREGYDFELTHLFSGLDPIRYPLRLAPTGEVGSIMAAFRYVRGGEKSTAWRLDALELEDATGNRWQSRNYASWGTDFIETPGCVPTNEVLKVRATFARERDFDTSALWHISGVPLPPRGAFLLFTNSVTNLSGVRLSLVGVSAGGVQIPNSGISSSAPLVHFQVEPQAQQHQWHVTLVSVSDEYDRAMPPAGDRRPLVSRNVACQFNYRPGRTNANFVIALTRLVTVEFMAKATAP